MLGIIPRCTVRFQPSILRANLTRVSLYATKPPSRAIPQTFPKASRKIPSVQLTAPLDHLALSSRQQQAVADRLFGEGINEIFRAPSHKGLLLACWVIAGSAIAGTLYIQSSKLWREATVIERGLPWWVSSAYGVSMIFLACMGGWCLGQSFFFIRSIKLVKDREVTKMLVTERRMVPFLPPKKYLFPPYALQIEREVVGYIHNPNALKTEVGRQASVGAEVGGILKKMALSPYNSVRKLFWHEGVLKVRVPKAKKDGTRMLYLDLDGKFSRGGQDLLNVATIKD